MLLETERLLLRPFIEDDRFAMATILSDPTTMRFWPRPLDDGEVAAWVERSIASHAAHGYGRCAMELRSTGGIIGDCGIVNAVVDGEDAVDLGYIVHHPYWGCGYATEAALAVAGHAFDTLSIEELRANMAHDNVASRRVAEKIGMRHVRDFHNQRNRMILTHLYALRGNAQTGHSRAGE